MCDRNANSECILIKLCALVFESICERTTKFHEKILFDSRVIKLQTLTTEYLFPVQRCLLQSLVQNWRCVVRTRSTFSRSVMVSVAVSSLGHTDLFFIGQGTKVNGQYYWDVLLHQQLLPAIRDLSGNFFTFQQDNTPAPHSARETMQLLTCETPDFIAPALWPSNSPDWTRRLPDVRKHRSWMHDVDQLKSRLIEE